MSTLRGKNKAKFREIRISNVPDRGGRVVVNCADDLKDSRDTRCYRVNVRELKDNSLNRINEQFNNKKNLLRKLINQVMNSMKHRKS